MTTPQTNDTGTPKELAIEYLRKNARYQNRAIDYESPTYKLFVCGRFIIYSSILIPSILTKILNR